MDSVKGGKLVDLTFLTFINVPRIQRVSANLQQTINIVFYILLLNHFLHWQKKGNSIINFILGLEPDFSSSNK